MALDHPSDFDLRMMRRALALARRGEGRVEPNPMVGCVIARGERVLGEGFHRRFGGPHAEVEALSSCQRRPRGATAYVTLEPCAHFGKTPPCADALIAAKIARLVVPFADPNPLVNGAGLQRLRATGIRVDVGACAEQAALLAAPFLTRTMLRRPYVIAKWAQSLDGSLSTPPGKSRWISSAESLREVHRLRARVDAIIVGSGTVLADDPRLTARDVIVRRIATRVILDSRLRIPGHATVVRTASSTPTIVFTERNRIKSRKGDELRRRGVEIVSCPRETRGPSPVSVLRELARRDMTNVLVEGGPTLLSSFLRSGLVDETLIFVAPKQFGRQGPTSLPVVSPLNSEVQVVGCDAMFRMRLTQPPMHC